MPRTRRWSPAFRGESDFERKLRTEQRRPRKLANTFRVSADPRALPHFEASCGPEPVPRGASRFEVSVDELPEPIKHSSVDRKVRVCAEYADGSTRLESPIGGMSGLFAHCDRGTIGWPGYNSLFQQSEKPMRGDAIPDVTHRRVAGYINAWHQAGLRP